MKFYTNIAFLLILLMFTLSLAFTPSNGTRVLDHVFLTQTPSNSIEFKLLLPTTTPIESLNPNFNVTLLAGIKKIEDIPIIKIWTTESFNEVLSFSPGERFPEYEITSTNWHPSRNLLAITYDSPEMDFLDLLDVENGNVSRINVSGRVSSFSWNQDGTMFAISNLSYVPEKAAISLWSLEGDFIREIQFPFDGSDSEVIYIAWHPELDSIATVSRNGSIFIVDTQEYDLEMTYPTVDDQLPAYQLVSWHPQNDVLTGSVCIRITGECMVFNWDVSLNNSSPQLFSHEQIHLGIPHSIKWNTRGTQLLFSDERNVVIYNGKTMKILEWYTSQADKIHSAIWASNASLIIVSRTSGIYAIETL